MNTVKKGVLWGGGIMLIVGFVGSLLGPSPLNVIFAPILNITYFPLTLIFESLGGWGGNYRIGFIFMFTIWNGIIGAIIGGIIGKIIKKGN